MKVTNLSSGSKGNSTYIAGKHTKVLVDCGVGIRYLSSALKDLGTDVAEIDALVITHEHSDHISGMDTLVHHNSNLHIYVNKQVWAEIVKKYSFLVNYQYVHFVEYETQFSVGEFTVLAMKNFHDSVSCASYIFAEEGGGSLGICTDLGIITDHQIDMLSRCKVVYLECNHDINLLAACHYPQILKNRISGNNGHLSNDQCAYASARLACGQTKVIVLSHISENSNLPEVAYSRVSAELEMANIKNTILLLAYQNKVGKTITIT